MCSSQPMISCSFDLIHWRHVRSCAPSPWNHATPSWHLPVIGKFDLCFEPVRAWSPLLMPSRHVRSVVPNPWDSATQTWYRVGRFDLMCLTRKILQPRPDTLSACWICWSEPVRPCSPVLISRKHLRSDVPYQWGPAAPSWYRLCMYDLVFRTRKICSPVRILCRHVRSCAPSPWDHATPSWHLIGTFDLVFRTREIPMYPPDA